VQTLGPQRGAEELPRWLNRIYDGLIADVTRYRGSVISFSGDAVTCWFDDANGGPLAALRATASALAIQRAMQQFAHVDMQSGPMMGPWGRANMVVGGTFM